MSALYELADAYQKAIRQSEEQGDDSPSLTELLDAIEEDVEAKIEQIARADKSTDAAIESLSTEIARLAARKHSLENKKQNFRAYLKHCLGKLGTAQY